MRRVAVAAALCVSLWASLSSQSIPQDSGASGAWQKILKVRTTASVLHATAHPDDENAGVRAVLGRRDGARVPLDTGGLILGMIEDESYEEAAITLEPGDLLLLFSDGITESFSPLDRLFGMEGLEATVARARHGSAQEIVDAIMGAVSEHASGRAQTDDMTLVALRRHA